MSDEKPKETTNASADDLAKAKKPGDVQLHEEELDKVAGGGSISYQEVKIDYHLQKD